MIKGTVTPQEVVDYLNELIELDRPAIAALIANRVPCNNALADHPTAQVMSQHGGYSIGMLGLLNGLFGVDKNGYGTITARFEDQEKNTKKLASLVNFEITSVER